MKNKFKLEIEISKSVHDTAVPKKIKRYDTIEKKKVKISEVDKYKFYRYRPGVNSFINGDFDV